MQGWPLDFAVRAPLTPDMRNLFPSSFFAYRQTRSLPTHVDSDNMIGWMQANSTPASGNTFVMSGVRDRGANTASFSQVYGAYIQEVGDPKIQYPSSVPFQDRAAPALPARLMQNDPSYGFPNKSDVSSFVRFPSYTVYEGWKFALAPGGTSDVRVHLISRFERKVYDIFRWGPWLNNGYNAAHWGVYDTGPGASLDRTQANGSGGSAGRIPAFALHLTIWDVLHFQGHWLSVHPMIYGRNFGNLSSNQAERIGYVWPARATETGTLTSEAKHAPPHGTLLRLTAAAAQNLFDNVLPTTATHARWIVHMLRDWGMLITDRTGSVNKIDAYCDDRWETSSIRNQLLPNLSWSSFEVVNTESIWNRVGNWAVGGGVAGPWGPTSWNSRWGD